MPQKLAFLKCTASLQTDQNVKSYIVNFTMCYLLWSDETYRQNCMKPQQLMISNWPVNTPKKDLRKVVNIVFSNPK